VESKAGATGAGATGAGPPEPRYRCHVPSRSATRLALLAALAITGVAAPPASALESSARYTLANGCYELRSEALGKVVATDTGPLRLQATALGNYLLYGKRGDFLTASDGGSVGPTAAPSEQGDWRVDVKGEAFTLTLPSGKALATDASGALVAAAAPGAFSFVKADGCAVYPEATTDVTGEPTRGESPFGQVEGLLETHLHWMAFEAFGGRAHCGRPWDRYGVAFAMVDCADHQPGGKGLVFENVLSGFSPAATHDTVGWPTFKDWPNRLSLTHEGTYYKWVERAWRGGLRVLVNLNVDNAMLCEVQAEKNHNCNEMDTVRLQIKQLKALQDYVDAQFGGPGKGWLRIVDNPFEARQVINDGKLAVINGIEISRLFDCRAVNDEPQCNRAQIDRQLDEMRGLGVRDLQVAVKTDNALAGAAGDPGTNGIVTNNGNHNETGHYFDMRTCTGASGEADKTQVTFGPASTGPGADFARALSIGGQTPIYPPPPHCNQRGLTDLGEYLVRRMMDKQIIIDPDHMSVLARQHALSLLEARRYSGVVSSHSWSTPDAEARIYKLGGVVTPKTSAIAQSSDSSWFVGEWKRLRAMRDPRYLFGIGFGSDMNGVAKQPAPREDQTKVQPVTYPFKSFDGKQTINQHVSGKRVWDFNNEGVPQYGMYLDWIQELRNRTNDEITPDLARGAEAYLQMWERAEGVAAQRPQPARARFTRRGLGDVHLGGTSEALLRAAGQPVVRGPFVWRYGVQEREGRHGQITALLGAEGGPVLVASTYPEHEARGVGAGDRSTAALKGTRKLAGGLRVSAAGDGARYVYGTRRGRVRFAAVATGPAARTTAGLRAALRSAGLLARR
jgi:hypothetical protein